MSNWKSRDTIFSEAFLTKPSPTKFHKKREFSSISQFTGLTLPPKDNFDSIKPSTPSTATNKSRNLNVSDHNITPQTTKSCKARGHFFKDPMNQSLDINLLGIHNPKKHFEKTDNIKGYSVKPQASFFMNTAEKHDRVKGYMNSDQIKNTLAQDHARYYRGLLG